MNEREPNDLESAPNGVFILGQVVNVRRSSGEIDSGWTIKGRHPNGMYMLDKDVVGTKNQTEEELLEVNPAVGSPESTPDEREHALATELQHCQRPKEIVAVLLKQGFSSIPSSGKAEGIPLADVIDIIYLFSSANLDPTFLPRYGGLRDRIKAIYSL